VRLTAKIPSDSRKIIPFQQKSVPLSLLPYKQRQVPVAKDRVCEKQDNRDQKAVNTGGLRHGQAYEHRTGDRPPRLGLARYRLDSVGSDVALPYSCEQTVEQGDGCRYLGGCENKSQWID